MSESAAEFAERLLHEAVSSDGADVYTHEDIAEGLIATRDAAIRQETIRDVLSTIAGSNQGPMSSDRQQGFRAAMRRVESMLPSAKDPNDG